jgi:Uri superfamily endonuclease
MISAIIYAIIDNGYFYIGSTKKSLLEQIEEHIVASKSKSKNSKLYKYINKIRGGWEDIIIITLETYECKTEKELQDKEYEKIKEHIKDPLCLNVIKSERQPYIINSYYKKHKKN